MCSNVMHLKDKHLMCRARRMMGNVVCALKLLISPVKKCLYRALFSGENRDARPSASLSRTSLSCLGLLKSDGRLRICTSFLNCSHRAFCGRKKKERLNTDTLSLDCSALLRCCVFSAAEHKRFTAHAAD